MRGQYFSHYAPSLQPIFASRRARHVIGSLRTYLILTSDGVTLQLPRRLVDSDAEPTFSNSIASLLEFNTVPSRIRHRPFSNSIPSPPTQTSQTPFCQVLVVAGLALVFALLYMQKRHTIGFTCYRA